MTLRSHDSVMATELYVRDDMVTDPTVDERTKFDSSTVGSVSRSSCTSSSVATTLSWILTILAATLPLLIRTTQGSLIAPPDRATTRFYRSRGCSTFLHNKMSSRSPFTGDLEDIFNCKVRVEASPVAPMRSFSSLPAPLKSERRRLR